MSKEDFMTISEISSTVCGFKMVIIYRRVDVSFTAQKLYGISVSIDLHYVSSTLSRNMGDAAKYLTDVP